MGIRVFLPFKVLNDRHSVLLLLKSYFSGGFKDERWTKTKTECAAQERRRVRADCGCAWNIYKYSKVILQTAWSVISCKAISLWAVRQNDWTESWTEAETFLLGFMPEQMVEHPSGASEAEGSLYIHLPELRQGIQSLRQQPSEILLPCLLYRIPIRGWTPWIKGCFTMKQPSRWRCIWRGRCWQRKSSLRRRTGISSRRCSSNISPFPAIYTLAYIKQSDI